MIFAVVSITHRLKGTPQRDKYKIINILISVKLCAKL
jgi:hypothetical protein